MDRVVQRGHYSTRTSELALVLLFLARSTPPSGSGNVLPFEVIARL